jgi:hypothetical protein
MTNKHKLSQTKTQMSLVICIPTYGAPYIHYEFNTKKEFKAILTKMKEEEQQEMTLFNERVVIHPMFYDKEEDGTISRKHSQWYQVAVLIKNNIGDLYADDDCDKFSPNMATIVESKYRGGCPHVCGEMYLIVKVKDLKKVKMDKTMFQTFDEYKHEMGEDDDDEDDDDEKEENE